MADLPLQPTPPPAPSIWDVDAATYHADLSRDSAHSLSTFRESVELYAAVRVFKTLPPPEPTDAMRLGSALHTLVFEPDGFAAYAPAPKIDRRTKEGKAAWEAMQASGKTYLAADDWDAIHRMRDKVMAHPIAGDLVRAPGLVEQSAVWDDAPTAQPMRMRCDKLLPGAGLVVDLKTTAGEVSPEAFGRSAGDYGYHRQNAVYVDGCAAACGMDGARFLFVVVSKDEPHEVGVFELPGQAVAHGRLQYQRALMELADRRRSGNWVGRYSIGTHEAVLLPWRLTER